LSDGLSHAISESVNSGSISHLVSKVLLIGNSDASLSDFIKAPVELYLFSADLMVLKEVTFFLNSINILVRDNPVVEFFILVILSSFVAAAEEHGIN